jgi:hypothetical protein
MAAADVGGHDVPGSSAPDTVGALLVGHLPPAPTGLYTGEERWRFYVEPPEPRRRTSRNRTTLLSLERYAGYEPGTALVALRTPLVVILADADTIKPTGLIRDAVRSRRNNVHARAGAVTARSTPSTEIALPERPRRSPQEHLTGAWAILRGGQAFVAIPRPSATAKARSNVARGSAGISAAR